MSIRVVENTLRTVWGPVSMVNGTTYDTLYVGQLVYAGAGADGWHNFATAAGVGDTTNPRSMFGVVVGTNNRTPEFDATNGQRITSQDPHDNTTEYAFAEGIGAPVGDTAAYVEVAVIGPHTVLNAPIYNAAYGTAITEGTVTTGSTAGEGLTCTGGLSDASTPVADLGTLYCRTGLNAGVYRVTTDTSATVKTVDLNFPRDIEVGDVFVNVQMRPFGVSYVQTGAEANYINAAANPATDHLIINVLSLDLTTTGKENVTFCLNGDHFSHLRA